LHLLSGVYDKTEAPKTLYLYVDYSDAMKLNNSDLNFYTDSLMKELSLEETRLFISGREIVSPLKGELSLDPALLTPCEAASKIVEMKDNALRESGIPFYLSFRDLGMYRTGVNGGANERFLKTLIILNASKAIDIFASKDTLCIISLEDKKGMPAKTITAQLKKGLNRIDAGDSDYYSARIGKERVFNHNIEEKKIKVFYREENVFLKSALKALGYGFGDGVRIGENGNIKFSEGRGYGKRKKTFLISMTEDAKDAVGDTIKGFYFSNLHEIPGRVIIKTSDNEPLLSKDNGIYYFAVSLDTLISNLPLIPEFIPLLDMLIRSSAGVEYESTGLANRIERSDPPVLISKSVEKVENLGRKNRILPVLAGLLLTMFIFI